MNTTLPRPALADALTTTHPPTLEQHDVRFDRRPNRAERLQLRVGLWLIRRATRTPYRQSDPLAARRRVDHVRAHHDRELRRFTATQPWR